MGSFFKQVYRYSHPRPYRHNENLWPYMKIVRASSGEIAELWYKKRPVPLVPLSELRGSCQGDVLLTATGPSINALPFDALPAMPAIGVNGAYFLHQQVAFRFYVIVDMGFIDQRSDIVRDIVQTAGLTLFTTAHGVARIIDRFTLAGIRCRLSVLEDAAFKIYCPRIAPEALWDHYRREGSMCFSAADRRVGFSQDIRRGVFDAGTVSYWALQIIAFLGFNQLFIAGLDMNNFHLPRFYETKDNMQPTYLPEQVDSIVMPAFRFASEIMRSNAMSIKNLSPTSAISGEIFEKVDCQAYFMPG